MAAILKGFRFGMLLQLAVGPVCILIFQIAGNSGFAAAILGVFGAFAADALFIILAAIGIAAIIEKEYVKKWLGLIGALVLAAFGINIILESFGMHMFPIFPMAGDTGVGGYFLSVFLLTLSNPLTIVFWAGVFSAKLTEDGLSGSEIFAFAAGCLLSTLLFLSLIAAVGSMITVFLTVFMMKLLNCMVGFLLLFFACRMYLKQIRH